MFNSFIFDQSVLKVVLILIDGKSMSGIEFFYQFVMYVDRNNVYVMGIGVGEEVNLFFMEFDNMIYGINEY